MVSTLSAIVAAIFIVVMVYRFREAIRYWSFTLPALTFIGVWEWWTGRRFDD